MENFEVYLNVAIEASKKGAEWIKKGFDSPKTIELKGYADPVTEFDRGSEDAIVKHLTNVFPEHSIIAEEGHNQDQKSDFRWIIDPLDGTVNFTHRIPFVAVSIGLEYKGRMVAGVIYNPILNELYAAAEGQGAYCNNTRLSVSKISDIGKSLIATGFPYKRDGRVSELLKPMPTIIKDYEGFRRFGSAAMDIAYLASGRCEIFYEEGLKPWDTAAGVILVKEAGGKVTDYYNNPYSVEHPTILATNGILHSTMQKLLEPIVSP